jgi:pimeloyl-ACP methyl ester carboxylesterase
MGVATAGYADVEDGHLYYERAGEGFPVVLLHPSLWDLRIWDPQFEAFAEHHDVVRYDLRGYGRSEAPSHPYSDLRDLRHLLGELGIERCALVGCSLGAQLAIDFVLAHPHVADAVVAESPGLTGYPWKDAGVSELASAVDQAVRAGDLAGAMEVELAVWAPPRHGWQGDELIRTVAMDNLPLFRLEDGLAESPPSAVLRLAEISAAVLVVVGHDDLGEVHHIADAIAAGVPGAAKRVVAEADHLVHVRKPEKFNRMVLDFLAFRE